MRKVSSSSLSSAFQARGPSIPTENGFKGQDDNYRLEMEHLRKKLQRTTIESVGVNGVQLWAAALRLMTVARAIFPPGVILPPTFVIAPTEEPPESPLHKEDVVELGGTDDSIFPPLPPIFQAFPHKTLRIVASSEAATTTSAASTASKPTRGKGLAPRGSPTKSEKSSTAKDSTTPATLPANNSNKGRNRSTTVTSSRSLLKYVFEHRSGTWPAGLLPYLWNRVLLQTASADGILSATQRNAVIRYASDRNTLKIELQSQGKADSHQLWGILDRMGCLAYEVDV
jgi:hypothetical protein